MRHERLGPFDVIVPETRTERLRGLVGRDGLDRGQGLLLERCRSVHTFGMRFAIDVVLLDRHWRVRRVIRMRPGRFLWPRAQVRHVLEIAEGSSDALDDGPLRSPASMTAGLRRSSQAPSTRAPTDRRPSGR